MYDYYIGFNDGCDDMLSASRRQFQPTFMALNRFRRFSSFFLDVDETDTVAETNLHSCAMASMRLITNHRKFRRKVTGRPV